MMGEFGLGGEHLLLRVGLRQRSGLAGVGLRAVHLGGVLRLHDRGLPSVFGLLARRRLLRLGGGLRGLGLGDQSLPLNGCLVRRGHRVDVAGVPVVDGLDLERVHDQADLCHLRLRGVQHLRGQFLAFGDDLLDGHRTDDRAQVAGEDPAGQHRHLLLVGEEPLPGVDDALGVVADLERDHGAYVQ